MTCQNSSSSGVWLIIGAAVLWGTTGTAQAFAPVTAHPISVGAMRLLVGGGFLLLVSLVRRKFNGQAPWPKKLLLLTAFFVAAYQGCFFLGVFKTGVAVGTMTAIGSSPVFAGILGYFFQGERPGYIWYCATCLAICGCLFLVGLGTDAQGDAVGILLALGAGLSYAAYTVGTKKMLETHRAETVVALVFSLAACLLMPFLFYFDQRWLVSRSGVLVAIHLGVLATAVSYWLFASGLKHVPVGTAATLSLAEPLTASCLGVLILQEQLSRLEWVGVVCLFAGICFLVIGPRIAPQAKRKE
ncbi:DMT family transporter [Desulfogranum japonicum]|uniref:DMT family transporter n=1 Tax=Desulfogranum japonicum TaxID=231447 RepID=UPI0003FA63CC|nr:EamA family transporter [Desulfogranum japonicum]